ncbi:MAG TPA: hypothetical protein VFP20_03065 [Bacteroidales bacterium]|nr:hypothetical protein [Bacteroidales bacterium]
MKATAILIGCLLVLLMACESHGPLKGIWKAANESLMPCVTFQNEVDTLNLTKLLPGNVCPDSVLAMGFSVSQLNEGKSVYQLILKKSRRNLHPIHLWKDGKEITMMSIHQNSFDTLTQKNLTSKGMLNNRLLIDCSGRPSELYVLWQNVQLPKSFFVFTKEGFATLIPAEAKTMENSTLRIFAVNDSMILFDSRVNLLYGKPKLP